MASVRVKFKPSPSANHEGSILYQIVHDRKQRQIRSDYHIFPAEWDEKRSILKTPKNNKREPIIISVRENIRCDMERLTKIIRKLEKDCIAYSADDIVNEYTLYIRKYSLFNFMKNIIRKLRVNGQTRTSETYTTTLNSFKKFRNDEDIMLDRLNSEVMERYEAWLRQRGIIPNTISFYTRILRAVYNRAVEHEIIENHYPFRHVYTGVEMTVKRALPLLMIKKIKSLDLSKSPKLDYARDMFMLSFMFRGMSFIDMAFLRKSYLSNGYLTYRRRKTGQLLIIKWTNDMQKILDKYPENRTDYLLPIITDSEINERNCYRNTGYNINYNLKTIAKKLGINTSLTLYVARHSWATAAKEKGVPLSVISEGMGHDREATTKIYLASLHTSEIDKANSLILKSL